jgi:hypothetical protein
MVILSLVGGLAGRWTTTYGSARRAPPRPALVITVRVSRAHFMTDARPRGEPRVQLPVLAIMEVGQKVGRPGDRVINPRGDELFVYYGGIHGPHGRPGHPTVERNHRGALGLVTLKHDRFVSLDAEAEEGWLLTKPFRLPEGALHLNVDAAHGRVSAALCDLSGKILVGYEKSSNIEGDQLAAVVRWGDGKAQSLAGQNVRLRLTARNAKIFSYWFAPARE